MRVPLSEVQSSSVGSATRSPMLTSGASASRRITDSRSSSILLFSTRLSQSSVRPTRPASTSLRLSAAPPVEGDGVADGQGLGHPSHASSFPTARETTPAGTRQAAVAEVLPEQLGLGLLGGIARQAGSGSVTSGRVAVAVLAPQAGRIVALVADRQTRIRTPDGLYLSGSLFTVDGARRAAVLVHGGGVTREEGGFFTRLAIGLGDAGVEIGRAHV